MSCVRENSPSTTMEYSDPASLLPEAQDTSKRRRRFNPLRNLRRIFRRRTVGHADGVRHTMNQHHQSTQIDSATIRPLGSQSVDDMPSCTATTTGQNYVGARYSHTMLPIGSTKYRRSPNDDVIDGEILDFQRSSSEGRLVDKDLCRQTYTHTHSNDSVFSESASSLSIVLKNELEDALRKRKGQSDVSDEDLGLPSSPSTSQRNGNHMNDRAPGLSPFRHNTQANHSPLNMLSMDSSEMDDDSFTSNTPGFLTSSSYLSSSKLNMSFSSTRTSDDELLAPSSNMSGRLSHSAARHKMAVRPKKNAPSRRGRISDTVSTSLSSTPEQSDETVGENSDVPQHVFGVGKIAETDKRVRISQASGIPIAEKTRSQCNLPSDHLVVDARQSAKPPATIDNTIKSPNKIDKDPKQKPNEGFFRNFLNRSARKQAPKEIVKIKDINDLMAKDQPKLDPERKKEPAIEKIDTLSILEVLAKARTAEKSIFDSPKGEMEKLKFPLPKAEKASSGAASRQRVLPQEITDSSNLISAETGNSKLIDDEPSTQQSNPMLTMANNSYRIVSRNFRQSQYRSEEFLNSERGRQDSVDDLKAAAGPHSISLPRSMWPNDTKFIQSPIRSVVSPRWNQRKISKINEQSDREFGSSNGKTVEKSKSFRLYTKAHAGTADDDRFSKYKSASSGNMPSLPDLSSSTPSFASPRGSNDFGPFYLNDKSSTRQSTSSLGSPDVGRNRFDINDFGFLPKSKPLRSETDSSRQSNEVLSTEGVVAHKPLGEIEDSIDQIMKSSLTTILRKSSTTDLYQVRTSADKSTLELMKGDIMEGNELGVATVVSPPLLHYSVTASKLDTKSFAQSKSASNIPEFLQIQLNRTETTGNKLKTPLESTRSTSTSFDEDKARRLSSESIEIADQKSTVNNGIRNSNHNLLKSTETPGKRKARPISSAATFDSSEDARSTDDSELDDGHLDTGMRARNTDVYESRRSVSDKKLKYEKRIEEIQHNMRRTSASGTAIATIEKNAQSRKSSIDSENSSVVLRNKRPSLCSSSSVNASDGTPELMKVFARRSLKIKDANDYLTDHDESPSEKQETKMISKNSVDSDKENQSGGDGLKGSTEKLASIIKADSIAPKSKGNRISTNIKEKGELLTKSNQLKDDPLVNKSKLKSENRFTAPASHFQDRKNLNNISTATVNVANTTGNIAISNHESKIENDNLNNNINTNTNTNSGACGLNNNLNSGKSLESNSPRTNAVDDCSSFKGILERRAEWEKRAKAYK